jgi:hypothetical protein
MVVYKCIWFNFLYMTVLMFPVFEMVFYVVRLYVNDSVPDLDFMTAKYNSQTGKKWKLCAMLDISQ